MILVTGATGLVGSHLIQALVASGKTVRAVYRTHIPKTAWAEKVNWVQGDILDTSSLAEALEGIAYVYHCAAVVSFHPRMRKALYEVNVTGTANLVNASLAAGVKKCLFVSSVAALGRIREGVHINETMHWSPETSNSLYGKTKYLAEMEVWRGIGEGLNAVIINPTIILGAGDWNNGSSGIFKSVYNEFPWYTDGVTGFVDVQDVVQAMQILMGSTISAERFIISADNLTYREVFTLMAKAFHKKPPHKKVTSFLAAVVWRIEAIKSRFTGKKPLLTKETAATARAKAYFDNTKFLQQVPSFEYTPFEASIQRICKEYEASYHL